MTIMLFSFEKYNLEDSDSRSIILTNPRIKTYFLGDIGKIPIPAKANNTREMISTHPLISTGINAAMDSGIRPNSIESTKTKHATSIIEVTDHLFILSI